MTEEFDSWLRDDERREEFRLNVACSLFIEVMSPVPGDTSPSRVVQCETLDLSANGAQVALPDKLTPGALLPLIIEVGDKRFDLMCDVMWCREGTLSLAQGAETLYLAGIRFVESDDLAYVEWKESVAERLLDDL